MIKLLFYISIIAEKLGMRREKVYYNLVKRLPMKKSKAIEILKQKGFFLMVSTGRTGTTLFAKLLNENADTFAIHEPVVREQTFHRKCLEDGQYSDVYMDEFRWKETAFRIKNLKEKRYGEVNGCLRRNLESIRKNLPESTIIHIVRDGRDVVSSVLNRATFTEHDIVYQGIQLSSQIIDNQQWNSFNRFQKIVFFWKMENEYMRQHTHKTVVFERLISDYAYAKEELFEPLGVSISEEVWRQFTAKKVNANKKTDDRYKYENWTDEEKAFFREMCGEEMAQYGYKINT